MPSCFDYGTRASAPEREAALAGAVRSGRRVFTDVVAGYLRLASLIHAPGYVTADVVCDPDRSFGKPLFARGGARVADVLEWFWVGETIEELVAEFGVPWADLEDALRVAFRRAALDGPGDEPAGHDDDSRGVCQHRDVPTQFRGWSPAALDFYRALEGDNTKTFWAAHKSIYDVEVKAPFDALSDDLADEFGVLKVFRPHRDVRFSTDKSPYKTRCYAVAGGPGGESYYVELSADGLVAATGYWMMAADQLARYRAAVDDDRTGSALEDALAQVRAQHLDVEGQGLKTAPRGYRRDHPRIELLRHTSVAVLRRFDPAPWLGTRAAATHITAVWRAGASMNAWLIAHVGPSRAGHVEKSGRASRADSARPLGSSQSS